MKSFYGDEDEDDDKENEGDDADSDSIDDNISLQQSLT